jgi:hypothetical protein
VLNIGNFFLGKISLDISNVVCYTIQWLANANLKFNILVSIS